MNMLCHETHEYTVSVIVCPPQVSYFFVGESRGRAAVDDFVAVSDGR